MGRASHPSWADTILGRAATESLAVRPASQVADSSLLPAASGDGSTLLTPADAGSATAATLLAGGSGRLRLATGGYEADRVLGVGGMGAVMLARQDGLDREVAIKVLRPEVADRERRALFAAETAIAARLSHPAIVPVHDAADGALVMRRVRGRSWSDALAAGPVPADRLPSEVGRLARVADAIAYAHDQGVVHRDLKPANIMVGDDGAVLVLDWGLALAGSAAAGRWSCPALAADPLLACAGTPTWIAPEAACGDAASVGPATDVFGVGAILHRLLAGRPPWASAGPHGALAMAAAGAVPALPAGVPPQLAGLRDRCLDPDPGRRPAAAEAAAGLRAWIHRADQERRALLLVDGLDGVPPGEAAARSADAHELAPDLPEVAAALAVAARRQVEAALAEDDLLAAAAVAPRLAPADGALVERVGRAVRARRAARRRTAGWIAAAALLGAAGLAGLVALALDGAGRGARAADERRRAAAALLAAAPAGPGAGADRARLLAALQAHGLAPGDPAAAALAASAATALVRHALADGDEDLARRHAATALRFAGPDLGDEIAAAVAERGAAARAELARQRARLAALTGADRGGLGTDWLDRAAEEIAGWPGTLAGIGLERLADGGPLDRRLLARVLSRRPAAATAALVARLASDGSLPPEAAEDLAAAGDPWPVLLAMDPWRARAVVRRRPVAAPAPDGFAAAWIRADGAAVAALAPDGDATALLAAAGVRWWQDLDLAAARALVRRAAAVDPVAASPWQAELAWAAGEPAAADGGPVAAPWLALDLAAAGRVDQARALLRSASAAAAAPWLWRWHDAARAAGDPALAAAFSAAEAPVLPDLLALAAGGMPGLRACTDALERHGPRPVVMAAAAEALAAAGHAASAAVLARAAARTAPGALRPALVQARLLAASGATLAAVQACERLDGMARAADPGVLAADGWRDAGHVRTAAGDAAVDVAPAADPWLSLRAARLRLAATPVTESRGVLAARSRAVAALLAVGDGAGVAALLLERRTGDDAGIRAGLDALCLASPGLRRTGWAGCEGPALALRCARAALGAARHGQDPGPWLADAARHGSVAPLDRLARALAAGDRSAGAAALARLPGDLPAEAWLAEALPGLVAWAAGGAPPDLPPPPRDGTGPGAAGGAILARWRERAAEWDRFAPQPGAGGDDGRVAAAFAAGAP